VEHGVQLDLRGITRIPQTKSIHQALLTLSKDDAWKMKEVFFKAYFVDGQDLSDEDVVKELLSDHGHPYNHGNSDELEKLLEENRMLGISAVPTFLLNNDISITGAQPVDRWINYLSKTIKRAV